MCTRRESIHGSAAAICQINPISAHIYLPSAPQMHAVKEKAESLTIGAESRWANHNGWACSCCDSLIVR